MRRALYILIAATVLCSWGSAVWGQDPCGTCGGDLTELTLRYDGNAADAMIRVTQKERSDVHVLFEGVVQPGEEFTVDGANSDGTLAPVIHIFVNGRLSTPIPTNNCTAIGALGYDKGDFTIVAGVSTEGGAFCVDDGGGDDGGGDDGGGDDGGGDDGSGDDGGGDDGSEDCAECDGQVTTLTLRYVGTQFDALIQAFQKVQNEREKIFEDVLQPGDEFTIIGFNNRGTFGARVALQVNTLLNTQIHTSCSEPIGPGLLSGAFEVVSGESRNGGALCEIEPPPDPACNCDGQVTYLTLRYNGTEEDARVQVFQKVRGERVELVDQFMQPGEEVTFQGVSNQGTLGAWIAVQVDTYLNARFHTSCSEPIGPGLVRGDFEVVAGASRNGGELCPIE